MNIRIAPVVILSLLIALCPAMTCRQGKAGAYQTLKAVQIATDAALQTYGTAVATNKVSLEKQAKVQAARTQYQEAFRLAVATARNDLAQSPPIDVQRLADQLILLISSL